MTFTTAALCLVLGLAGSEPDDAPGADLSEERLAPQPKEVAPTKAAPADAVKFDALPLPPTVSDDARVKRFLGAFTGGVLGLAATMALMPLGDSSCFGGRGCLAGSQVVFGAVAPFVSAFGSWLGYTIAGGEGGLMTPFLAIVPAGVLALILSLVANGAGAETVGALMPYFITSGVLLSGGAALALDIRSRQLDRLGRASTWAAAPAGRVAVTSLVSMLTVGAGIAATALVGALCRDGGCIALDVVLGSAAVIGAAAAVWGVHAAMGGRGSFLSALASMAIGTLVTFGAVALYAGGISFSGVGAIRSTASAMVAVEVGMISGIFLPALTLEWSHANAVEASMPSFSFGAAPTSGGGMVAGTMRF